MILYVLKTQRISGSTMCSFLYTIILVLYKHMIDFGIYYGFRFVVPTQEITEYIHRYLERPGGNSTFSAIADVPKLATNP